MNAGDGTAAVIGKSVQIRGEVKGSEDLMVDGHVEGTITLLESRLTIGPNAHVAANVSAKDVIVLGHLIGNVSATGRVELRDGCDLVGDISAGRLSIEENYRANIPIGSGVLIQFQFLNEDPGRLLERLGVETDFQIASVVPG